MAASGTPAMKQIANLWTLMQHPSRDAEWAVDEKVQAIAQAGFDGVCWAGSAEIQAAAVRHGLVFIGGLASSDPSRFASLLAAEKQFGAEQINVQLGSDDMLTPEALRLTLCLLEEAERLGVKPAIETHRGTCTETPEKFYALADAYEQATGRLLPVSWDFSHFAVVKHLTPDVFSERLLLRPGLIVNAQHMHLRPFNGHHAQVPITDGHGQLTREVEQWLPFAEALLRCWFEGNCGTSRVLYVCPELGPVEGGYALSTSPNSWEEAVVLRGVIASLWQRITGQATSSPTV